MCSYFSWCFWGLQSPRMLSRSDVGRRHAARQPKQRRRSMELTIIATQLLAPSHVARSETHRFAAQKRPLRVAAHQQESVQARSKNTRHREQPLSSGKTRRSLRKDAASASEQSRACHAVPIHKKRAPQSPHRFASLCALDRTTAS